MSKFRRRSRKSQVEAKAKVERKLNRSLNLNSKIWTLTVDIFLMLLFIRRLIGSAEEVKE